MLPTLGKWIALCAGMALLTAAVVAQESAHQRATALADWVRVARPEAGTPREICASSSLRQWKVTSAPGGGFTVELGDGKGRYDDLPFAFTSGVERPGERGTRTAISLANGWLVGVDVGESGGGLFWVTKQGASKAHILKEAVRDLIHLGDDLIVVAGRRASESTVIFRLERTRTGDWSAREAGSVSGYPIAGIPFSKGAALILTREGGFVFGKGEPKRVFSSDYRHFYPNSVAVSTVGSIALGMRHFVVRLTPENGQYREEWLVPPDCRNWEMINHACVCL